MRAIIEVSIEIEDDEQTDPIEQVQNAAELAEEKIVAALEGRFLHVSVNTTSVNE